MIEQTYEGESIRYEEGDNKWYWQGKPHVSLKTVKQAINKSQKVEFKRLPAIWRDWHQERLVTVTSRVDYDSVWVVDSKGKRHKVLLRYLSEVSEENDAKRKRAAELQAEADALEGEALELRSSLTPLVLPEPEAVVDASEESQPPERGGKRSK